MVVSYPTWVLGINSGPLQQHEISLTVELPLQSSWQHVIKKIAMKSS